MAYARYQHSAEDIAEEKAETLAELDKVLRTAPPAAHTRHTHAAHTRRTRHTRDAHAAHARHTRRTYPAKNAPHTHRHQQLDACDSPRPL